MLGDAPRGGVIVEVPGGTYHEKVVIDDRHGLVLRPRAGEQVIIDGSIEIRSSSAVEVRGFEVRSAAARGS